MTRLTQIVLLMLFLCIAGVLFTTGINWGLPSRESDQWLFNGRVPWTGDQIMQLAGAWEEDGPRGADIAMHPISSQRDQPIALNDTDAKRAQIVRRFRLYSNQPDEMITFRSLSRMKPARLDFDPRLYQYGGFWIYPVGALLKIGSLCHLITLRSDLAYYLDHPGDFARFYVVARAYSAAWGLIGFLVVYAIAREWSGTFSAGLTAAALYSALPVVIDLAHEAKPHLAGCVLILLTIWCAMKFVRCGKRRWYILSGVTAGAGVGMVLTAYVAFAVLPVMALLREMPWRDRIRITTLSALAGFVTIIISDPYLLLNVLLHREILHSNVGNYGSFYQPHLSWSGLVFAGRCLLRGVSTGPVLIGLLGMISVCTRRASFDRIGILFFAPVLLVMIQLVLLAEGKTAEYGRFAILIDVAIALFAAVLVDRLRFSDRERALGSALLVAAVLYVGIRYDLNFLADNRTDSTRRVAANQLSDLVPKYNELAVWTEPAPYCLPPVDLFHWKILLLPRGGEPSGHGVVSVRPVDELISTPAGASRITPLPEPDRAKSPSSWANKPFEILIR